MREKDLILTARLLSIIFTPFYLPILGLVVLFVFSYFEMLPWPYKLTVLALTYIFTILLPTLLIHVYRRYQGWTLIQLGAKEKRMVPYIISIMCYCVCFYIMELLNIPHFMSGILMGALVIQVACALINVWWKISTHTAAIGGVTGALIAFSILFMFNPVWWLCLVILIGGMVGTSRIILRQHSLEQVTVGFCIGVLAGFFCVWLY